MKKTNKIIMIIMLTLGIISCDCRCNITSFEQAEKIANEGIKDEKDIVAWNKSINTLLIKNGPNTLSNPLTAYIISFSKKDSIGQKNFEILIKAVNYDRLNEYDKNVIKFSKSELQLPENIRMRIQTKLDELPLNLSICDTYVSVDKLESDFDKDKYLINQFDFNNEKNLELFSKRRKEIQFETCQNFQKKYPTYETIPAGSIESDWFEETSFSDYYLNALEMYINKESFEDLAIDEKNDTYLANIPKNIQIKIAQRVRSALRESCRDEITKRQMSEAFRLLHVYVYDPNESNVEQQLSSNSLLADCIKKLINRSSSKDDLEKCLSLVDGLSNKIDSETIRQMIIKKL